MKLLMEVIMLIIFVVKVTKLLLVMVVIILVMRCIVFQVMTMLWCHNNFDLNS